MSTAAAIDFREHDRQVWEQELDDFVPPRIFDGHCHLLDLSHVPSGAIKSTTLFQRGTDLKRLRDAAQILYPGREVHFLILGTPLPGIDVRAHNAMIAAQIRGDVHSRGNRLVTPSCRPDDIRRDVKQFGFVGLKPYRIFSVTDDANRCRIHEFITHEQLELANELGLWITMHLSRSDGCADEANLADLSEFTQRRYPRIKWILAHCARSFTYWPILQAVDRLRDLPNIWYDVSAITDVAPLLTLFQREDRRRIFFGSDLIDATGFHGRYVPLGRAWAMLEADGLNFAHTDSRPILCIYEQLLAMKQAAELAELSRQDIDDIFWRNASREFGVAFGQQPT